MADFGVAVGHGAVRHSPTDRPTTATERSSNCSSLPVRPVRYDVLTFSQVILVHGPQKISELAFKSSTTPMPPSEAPSTAAHRRRPPTAKPAVNQNGAVTFPRAGKNGGGMPFGSVGAIKQWSNQGAAPASPMRGRAVRPASGGGSAAAVAITTISPTHAGHAPVCKNDSRKYHVWAGRARVHYGAGRVGGQAGLRT